MDLSLSHLNTVIHRSGEHTPNAVNMQTYGVHKYFILQEHGRRYTEASRAFRNTTYCSTDVPVEQQSQSAKQQRVKHVIDDLRLLAYTAVLQGVLGVQWLTAVEERT